MPTYKTYVKIGHSWGPQFIVHVSVISSHVFSAPTQTLQKIKGLTSDVWF